MDERRGLAAARRGFENNSLPFRQNGVQRRCRHRLNRVAFFIQLDRIETDQRPVCPAKDAI
ncbi:MAG: hypothetical protein WAN76_18945, partial [Candidatus Sulfotelmatobacter sp.]